ncbi:peptidoglycan bridge formation glycyltransferase FemA/FemB family protein [Candidatus Dojkabacteria bacterium]|nr:peptidoglycan bridge formation glycyltransferase FemA/FemB family protein [Candidatus Dojkabacteria bacterium]
MVFEVISEDKKKSWNSFVDNSLYGDILQYWQWGETKRGEGWNPVRVWVRSPQEKNQVILICAQILIKKVPFLGNYMYIPHGPLFLPGLNLAEARAALKTFIEELKKMAKESGSFAIEIEPKIGEYVSGVGEMSDGLRHFTDERLINLFENSGFKKTGRNLQPKYKLLYDLSKSDEELLNYMKKNTRYNVRYAEKHGVEVVETKFSDPKAKEKFEKFYELLKEMQKRTKGYPVRPKSSFMRLLKEFSKTHNLVFIEVKHNKETLAMNITQRTSNWAASFYAGSTRIKSNLKATYLMRWASIQSARRFGSKVYDFWGFIPNSKQHEGYSDNKLSFGGTRIDHVGIMGLPLNKIKYSLWNLMVPARRILYEAMRILKK